MKIQVREAGGKGFTLPLPNAMLFSPTVLKLLLKTARRYEHRHTPDIPPETVALLCAAIKAYNRAHGPWELVHVESASGDTVIITI